MSLFKMQVLVVLLMLCVPGPAQGNWVTIDFPGAMNTRAYGIDSDNVVGSYYDASGHYHGFLYDGTNWTTLDFPGAQNTYAQGIDGKNVVGYYWNASEGHGFIYTIPDPASAIMVGSWRRGPYLATQSGPSTEQGIAWADKRGIRLIRTWPRRSLDSREAASVNRIS